MRRMTIPGLIATLLLPLAASSSATAANEMTTSMQGGVLYESCADHDYSYSVALPAGFTYRWELNMELLGPDGLEVASDVLSTSEGASGISAFSICESLNLPGDYTIRGDGEACNTDYVCVAISAAASTTSFRLPESRTSLRAKPLRPAKGKMVRFSVTAEDERPTGYFGTSNTTVRLQVTRGGRWRTIEKYTTDERGRVSFRAPYSGRPFKVRALTESTIYVVGSTSPTIRIR